MSFQQSFVYLPVCHGVGANNPIAAHFALQPAKAVLQAAKAGVAAITAPGTVPKVKPAAEKQATAMAAHPDWQSP